MQTTGSHAGHQRAPAASAQPSIGPEKLPGIRHVIAVGSGQAGAVGDRHLKDRLR